MKFGEEYFKSGNYRDYMERDHKFVQQADELIEVLGLSPINSILDFGCAIGGLVAAFIDKGFAHTVGTDISGWAIAEGRKKWGLGPDVLMHYNRQLLEQGHDVVLFMDVLEHIPLDELKEVLSLVRNFIVVRVPVAVDEGGNFVLGISRNDKTHIQCHEKQWWLKLIRKFGFQEISTIRLQSIYESDGVLARVFKK